MFMDGIQQKNIYKNINTNHIMHKIIFSFKPVIFRRHIDIWHASFTNISL